MQLRTFSEWLKIVNIDEGFKTLPSPSGTFISSFTLLEWPSEFEHEFLLVHDPMYAMNFRMNPKQRVEMLVTSLKKKSPQS